ncbi:pectin lyase-like protein [Neocallimastix lanati (nom. inval.)]|nr:pectin lyase-like protein [Neocallimastix sp. JGI-2020a]
MKHALIVAKDGSGKYKTVQAAINALSSSANSERVIYIKNGTYKEQVTINKNYVTLIGQNKDKVVITYNLNNDKTGSSSECATVKVKADHFKAFENTQAPALYSYGNQHFFQNYTLLSYRGTHYFKNCYIRGVTDFIWGAGRAVFDGCSLHIPQNGKKMAYITANGNDDDKFKKGGFLITNSKVTVESGVNYYLGRLWKKNCYVIFNNTELPGSQLNKAGWLTFRGHDNYKNTSKVGEYKCYGVNYSSAGRVSYVTKYTSVPSIKDFPWG